MRRQVVEAVMWSSAVWRSVGHKSLKVCAPSRRVARVRRAYGLFNRVFLTKKLDLTYSIPIGYWVH